MSIKENDAFVSDFDAVHIEAGENCKKDPQRAAQRKLSNTRRLSIMLVLLAIFFLVELFTGAWTRSLALLSDALHMLSDAIAIMIGIFAAKMTERQTRGSHTYGWQRAELVGAFFNGVFLICACVFIAFESIERMSLESDQKIEQPWVVLGVGCAGLFVNIIGLLLFCTCCSGDSTEQDNASSHSLTHTHSHGHSGHSHRASADEEEDEPRRCDPNMRAVFLHVVADAVGSVFVITVALLNIFLNSDEHTWLFYVDPVLSLLLAIFIVFSAVGLVRQVARIFMQSAPDDLNLATLRSELLADERVMYLHALHVWQMTPTRLVGSVHIVVPTHLRRRERERLRSDLKKVFHRNNVHESAIQFENQSFDRPKNAGNQTCVDETQCCSKTVEHSHFS